MSRIKHPCTVGLCSECKAPAISYAGEPAVIREHTPECPQYICPNGTRVTTPLGAGVVQANVHRHYIILLDSKAQAAIPCDQVIREG